MALEDGPNGSKQVCFRYSGMYLIAVLEVEQCAFVVGKIVQCMREHKT